MKSLIVLLSVGGWEHGTGGFHQAAQNSSTFATNAANFIQLHGLDGIDIDWVYPGYVDQPKKLAHTLLSSETSNRKRLK